MIFSHIWAWSCSWQNSYIKNKCGVPVYIFVWGPAKRIQNPKHVLWSIRTGKNETWSLRQCIPSLSAQRRNEIRRRRPTKEPVCCSTFAEQGPMGNSTAITAQYCMCLNSCTGEEILNTGIHARRHVPSTEAWSNPHERTHAHTHTSFIDLGIKFMLRFLDVRRSSATDTAALVSTQLSDVWPKPALWRIVC